MRSCVKLFFPLTPRRSLLTSSNACKSYYPRSVKESRPSLTARGVALARSQLPRPRTAEGDAEAEKRLYAGLQMRLVRLFRIGGGRLMAARTRFFDEETLRAMIDGVKQVVIVGAGYDGRALRFRQSGVRFLEVDHPATQADKRRRMESLGVALDHVTFVAVDLMTERIEHALPSAGYRRSEASLFLCEGLLLYLSKPAVQSLLVGLRSLAAPGSRLVLTNREGAAKAAWVPISARQLLLAAIGEPRRSTFELGETANLLHRAGLTVAREARQSRKDKTERLLIRSEYNE